MVTPVLFGSCMHMLYQPSRGLQNSSQYYSTILSRVSDAITSAIGKFFTDGTWINRQQTFNLSSFLFVSFTTQRGINYYFN